MASRRPALEPVELMRTLIATVVALGLASASPALAGDAPKTKADCEKAGMKWDEASQTCLNAKSRSTRLSPGRIAGARQRPHEGYAA